MKHSAIRAMVERDSPERLPACDEEPRVGLSEICRIAKVSRQTIARRIKKECFPRPIDRGREQLFDRSAVYGALGITQGRVNYENEQENPWLRGARAIIESETTSIRGHQTARS